MGEIVVKSRAVAGFKFLRVDKFEAPHTPSRFYLVSYKTKHYL